MLWFRVKSAGGACSQKRWIAPRSDRLLAGKNGDFGNLDDPEPSGGPALRKKDFSGFHTALMLLGRVHTSEALR
jgi:hypothetical protein